MPQWVPIFFQILRIISSLEVFTMTTANSLFEAPAHEAHYSNPYSNPEFESEWENNKTHYSNPEAHYSNPYSNPEFENEWENNETHYSNPEAHYSNPYSNPEFEDEWENNETLYSNPEAHYSNSYSNPEFEDEWENNEFEDEGELFFKKAFRSIGRGLKAVVKVAAPLAKRFAPILAGKLATMIPGIGVVAGPLAAKLTRHLLKEGEMESMQMEAEFFGANEAEAEVANHEMAHEAALTEFLAAQAAEATNEAESEAAIAATLPITIRIMGGQRALRPVTPILAQATGRMTQLLRQQGPAGRQLLRTVPTIQRQAIATLKAAARNGQPINSATAIRALASSTNRVLGTPQRVQQAIVRNAVLRQRTAPPTPRRMADPMMGNSPMGGPRHCPNCATPIPMRIR
jgi:hypothetical protein